MTIKVGIVGFGPSGKILHGRLLRGLSQFEITDIVTSQKELALSEHANANIHQNFNDFLEKKNCELVVIASPNQFHFSQVKDCLNQGLHVVVEKPFTTTSEEALELIKLAKERDLVLSVFQNRRFDSDLLTVKRMIDDGRLGNVKLFEGNYHRYSPGIWDNWRYHNNVPGAGTFLDLGAHLLDQALYLFGKPKAVFADIHSQRDPNLPDDYFHVTFFYEDKRVILKAGTLIPSSEPRYIVHGDKASFFKKGIDPQEAQLRVENLSPLDSKFGVEPESLSGKICFPDGKEEVIVSEKGCSQNYYFQISEAIQKKRPLPVSHEEALDLMKLYELCFKSSDSGSRLKFG
ncbi:MAG: Gfo/Idh/MocA family oxidoreductase [Bacteriovoracaceae bacterium]